VKRTVVAIVVVVGLLFALAGCSPSQSVADIRKAECIQNMAFIRTEMGLFMSDTGEYPPLADVLDKTGRKCPSGGTYSFDANTGTLSCSIHGVYKP
jgi:hypothetical protein